MIVRSSNLATNLLLDQVGLPRSPWCGARRRRDRAASPAAGSRTRGPRRRPGQPGHGRRPGRVLAAHRDRDAGRAGRVRRDPTCCRAGAPRRPRRRAARRGPRRAQDRLGRRGAHSAGLVRPADAPPYVIARLHHRRRPRRRHALHRRASARTVWEGAPVTDQGRAHAPGVRAAAHAVRHRAAPRPRPPRPCVVEVVDSDGRHRLRRGAAGVAGDRRVAGRRARPASSGPLGPLSTGRDADDLAGLQPGSCRARWPRNDGAKAAVDVALHDLAARRLGVTAGRYARRHGPCGADRRHPRRRATREALGDGRPRPGRRGLPACSR